MRVEVLIGRKGRVGGYFSSPEIEDDSTPKMSEAMSILFHHHAGGRYLHRFRQLVERSITSHGTAEEKIVKPRSDP